MAAELQRCIRRLASPARRHLQGGAHRELLLVWSGGRPAASPRLGLCLGAVTAAGLLLQRRPSSMATLMQQPLACGDSCRGSLDVNTTSTQQVQPAGARPSRLHIVLDMDETLVHSFQADPYSLISRIPASSEEFSVILPGGVPIRVSKRPGLDDFLRWLRAQGYEVSVYTAGTRKYAEALLPRLDPEGVIGSFLSREDCVPLPSLFNVFVKDLRRVRSECVGPDGGRQMAPADLARTVLVDNNPLSFALQPENGILVSDWLGGSVEDAEFERVKAVLLALEEKRGSSCFDVREVLPGLQTCDIRKRIAELSERMMLSSL